MKCLFFVLSLAVPAGARAQRAEPLLRSDHWSYTALRRIEALVPGVAIGDYAGATLSAAEVEARLRSVIERGDPGAQAMAASYLDLLEREQRDLAPERTLLRAQAALAGERARGRAAPGQGFIRGEDWTGARALPDRDAALGSAAAAIGRGALAAELATTIEPDGVTFENSHAVLGVSRLGVWAGERRQRYSVASSGIVLNATAPFAGGGVFLREPIVLPAFLRYLGPIRFEAFLSKMERNGNIEDPFFFGARGSFQPLANLVFGINRGVIFGGEGRRMRVVDILEMLVGGYGGKLGEFENQVLSLDGRLLIQSARQPVELFVEWGTDDADGMWYKAPAITAGIALPVLGSWRTASVMLERTVIYERPQRGNTYWYRHVFNRGSWAKDDDYLLGHALGGHGSETRLSLGQDWFNARLRLRAAGWLRDRGEENTYAPEREGRSAGVNLGADWRIRRAELGVRAAGESGSGWDAHLLQLGLTLFF